MKKTLSTLFFASLFSLGFAQQPAEVAKSNLQIDHKIGVQLDFTIGTGLMYKMEINKKHQVQVTALPILSQDYQVLGLGLAYNYKFRDYENWDCFLYGGIANYNELGLEWQESLKTTSVGFHFEYGKSENFKVNFNTGYGLYHFDEDFWSTNLTAGIGIDFKISK